MKPQHWIFKYRHGRNKIASCEIALFNLNEAEFAESPGGITCVQCRAKYEDWLYEQFDALVEKASPFFRSEGEGAFAKWLSTTTKGYLDE